ncbi:hypothetical protein OAD74_08980 [Alphaproteobacteria bacterium]|nr:hypothetical protein [Alphaproteobacteria bacterium]
MFTITKHADRRLNQRGVKGATFRLFLQYADREVDVGSGDVALSVSKGQCLAIARTGVEADIVRKLSRLAVVCSPGGVIKTCLIANDKRGKRYVGERKRGQNDVRRAFANDNCPLLRKE